jgi:glutamate synthase domain-containing protein 3
MTGSDKREATSASASGSSPSPVAPDSAAVRKVPTGPARKGPTGIEPARITAGQPGTARGTAVRRGTVVRIDGRGVYYKTLNEQIREELERGATEVVLDNVIGQRYIGTGLSFRTVTVTVNGVPGNDLAAFMNGPALVVNENAQDGVANTMNSGLVVINGNAGDVLGYGMRGGSVYVRGNVGYRVGIHMKAFGDSRPLIVVGGHARDFLGEYMAGGEIVVLGLDVPGSGARGSLVPKEPVVGSYVGTGMHAGVMYIRGSVAGHQLGKEVRTAEPDRADQERIRDIVLDYSRVMGIDSEAILAAPFTKIYPYTSRPYGRFYVY